MNAVILFSGGLDSTVMLAMAVAAKRTCYAVSFDYGQRHRIELESARTIAHYFNVKHKIIVIDPTAFGNAALVSDKKIPQNRSLEEIKNELKIPSTYVPARNTLFLAYATGHAELVEAEEIYFGANAMDHQGYVDCRPAFVTAFQNVMNIATKQAVEKFPPKLITPLLYLTKKQIVNLGRDLKAPLELSWSCYDPLTNGNPCSICDACIIRQDALYKAD